jgi:hypothetical protein
MKARVIEEICMEEIAGNSYRVVRVDGDPDRYVFAWGEHAFVNEFDVEKNSHIDVRTLGGYVVSASSSAILEIADLHMFLAREDARARSVLH